MSKSIALLCHSRIDCLAKTLSSLLMADRLNEYNLSLFIDGPRNSKEEGLVSTVHNVVRSYLPFIKAKSVNIYPSPVNTGVWKAKINAFKDCFDSGADVVLLLEDDVVVRQDALTFVDEASAYVHSWNNQLITISLYSHHLSKAKKLTYINAFKYIASDPGFEAKWACRKWPFPWGIALTKNAFDTLMANRWTGNDQNMGMILQEQGGYDVYPILSRSEHIGSFSSTSQSEITLEHHISPPFKQVKTYNINPLIHPDDGCKVAGMYQSKLDSDQGIKDNIIKVYYRDPAELRLVASMYGSHYHIIESQVPLSVSSQDEESLKGLMSRTECANIVICVDDHFLAEGLAKHAKSICKVRLIDPSGLAP